MELSLINLLMVLLAAALGGALATRLGYPSMMGEMLAGILFGPMLLGWLHASEGLTLLAEIGVFLMMLYIGIEVDHRDLMKASWPGVLAALGGFVVPFVAGYVALTVWQAADAATGLFAGLIMGITSLATKSRALIELKLLGTRVANVLLAAALVCDTLALVVFAAIVGLVEAGAPQLSGALLVAGKALLFFGAAIFIGLRVFPLIGRLFRALKFTERTTNFTLVIMIGLLFAEMAEIAGLHSIIGAFIAGLFIREEVLKRKVSHEVSGMVHDVSIGFLAPVFFVTAGFKVDVSVLWTNTALLAGLAALAILAKMAGAWLFYAPARRGWREGLVVGAGMNGQGAVAIIIAEIGLQQGMIDQSVFSLMVFLSFLTTAAEPVLIKTGTRWLRRHDALVRADDHRNLIMIAGATALARRLAKMLAVTEPVCLFDSNAHMVQAAHAEGLKAQKGNVLSEDFLDVAGAANGRAFIAMTTNQEVNRISAQQARTLFGVPQAWIWPVASAVPPATANRIPLEVSAWNDWIQRGETEEVVDPVKQPEVVTSMDALAASRQYLPLVVERGGRRYPVLMMDELRKDDRIIGLRHNATNKT